MQNVIICADEDEEEQTEPGGVDDPNKETEEVAPARD
jgi:hypothetical protein